MSELVAFCGLDCKKCDARIATLNHDDALRKEVAELWSRLNGAEITPEMINCAGCCADGVKTPYCSDICQIRKCAVSRKLHSCGSCTEMDRCSALEAVISNNPQVLENLKKR